MMYEDIARTYVSDNASHIEAAPVHTSISHADMHRYIAHARNLRSQAINEMLKHAFSKLRGLFGGAPAAAS